MVANLTTVVIYRGTAVIYRDILTLENVANAVNYCCIFITLAPGETVRKNLFEPKTWFHLLLTIFSLSLSILAETVEDKRIEKKNVSFKIFPKLFEI